MTSEPDDGADGRGLAARRRATVDASREPVPRLLRKGEAHPRLVVPAALAGAEDVGEVPDGPAEVVREAGREPRLVRGHPRRAAQTPT